MVDAASRRSTARVWALAATGVAGYVVLRAFVVHGLGRFPVAGRAFVGPGAPAQLHVFSGGGYDGQFVYRLALDPFTTRLTSHGITFDSPGYRQQRIMTALLTHVLAWVPGVSTGLALVLVNGMAVIVCVVAGVRLAEDVGRHGAWGLTVALPACIPLSLARDLTEPVAWAGVLVAMVLIRRARWSLAAVALTVAVLARETSEIVVAGLVVESIVIWVRSRGSAPGRLWLVVPIAVEAAWQWHLRDVWGRLPALSGPANNTTVAPFLGVARNFLDGLAGGTQTDRGLGLTYLAERIVLVALLCAAAWIVAHGRTRLAISAAWLLAAYVAVSLRAWVNDVQFLRATLEAWGLSVLVVLGSRERWASTMLALSGVITAGVGLLYVVRV